MSVTVHYMYIMNTKKVQAIPLDMRDIAHDIMRVSCVNPFTHERHQLNEKLLGTSVTDSTNVRKALRDYADSFISQLEKTGISSIHDVVLEDRDCLTYVYLFYVYHHFMEEMDALIKKQLNSNETLPVPFADDIYSTLIDKGCNKNDIARYISIFYQMRRAYYFIDTALIGKSPSIAQLRCELWDTLFTHDILWYERMLWDKLEDFSVLILGATGTGKGSAAATIGHSGFIPFDTKRGLFTENFTASFIPLNLSQFPASLIESELFGHTKGAFTGAHKAHEGLFSLSTPHGAVFLDEIGDVDVHLQIKLLKVLEERLYSPVGSHEQCRFDGRIIAATHRPLAELRETTLFRDDFYYRLCSSIITVPSLHTRIREEAEEMQLLTSHLLTRICGEFDEKLYAHVCERLDACIPTDYCWPGNVRELEQSIRHILLNDRCSPSVDYSTNDAEKSQLFFDPVTSEPVTIQELTNVYCGMLYKKYGSYQDVARHTGLDRRTVKKYIEQEDSDNE